MTRRWPAVFLAILTGYGVVIADRVPGARAQSQRDASMTFTPSPLDAFLLRLLDEAAAMPLKDAAFQLWRWKHNFDSHELPSPPPVDTKDPMLLEQLKGADFSTIYQFERAHAHDGITFDRMRRVHPNATDVDIKAAIKAAVKLDDDCNRYFDRNYTDFAAAIDSALAKATRENPGFRPTTYRAAGSYLLYLWK
jgi:hypothetical protein